MHVLNATGLYAQNFMICIRYHNKKLAAFPTLYHLPAFLFSVPFILLIKLLEN